MLKNIFRINLLIIIFLFSLNSILRAEIINKIEIEGNNRISSETVKMFSGVSISDDLSDNDLNKILKRLYDSNFFELVSVKVENNVLIINIKENPIIQNINYEGIKSKTILSDLKKNVILKSRSSFNKVLLKKDEKKINNFLKDLGYYFSEIDISIEELQDNKINLTYNITLGNKAKIRKISFVGNKVFKDKKLKNIILSEEYKGWKFLSGKKFLNETMINYDKRLLKNFYLNKGFYNVIIKSSYAKLLDDQEFELVFNIEANPKIYFGKLDLDLPSDFDKSNYEKIEKFFNELENEPYSLSRVEDILEKIETITINEQYASTKATVEENIIKDKINLVFKIMEVDRVFVKKINILGNNFF